MPPKSNTELIQRLDETVTIVRLELGVVRTQVAAAALPDLAQRVARLEVQVAELVKTKDETGRRYMQVAVVLASALSALVTGLATTVLAALLRK